jgi:3-keto-5-aminohexanoate cleavage enzyme
MGATSSSTPVIIEAAVNGPTTREANPNVPISAEEIASDAIACFDAGAAIVHAHCSPVGGPDEEVAQRYLDAFLPVWDARPGALLYPTLNFGPDSDGLGHLPTLAAHGLRIGPLDPGSVNLGRVDDRGVPVGGFVYANSYRWIAEHVALHAELDLGMSLAIYEPGFLRTTLAYERAGLFPPGTMLKLYLSTERGILGAPFGLPPTLTALHAYLELLEGSSLPWAVSVVGGDVGRSEVAVAALERGGHLHLGLEFYGGERTPSNPDLVGEAVDLCERVGRPVATHDETVALLDLPER